MSVIEHGRFNVTLLLSDGGRIQFDGISHDAVSFLMQAAASCGNAEGVVIETADGE